MGAAPAPAHDEPTPQLAQVSPNDPELSQRPDAADEEYDPAVHVHAISACEAPPEHETPNPHGMHEPLVSLQPDEIVDEE